MSGIKLDDSVWKRNNKFDSDGGHKCVFTLNGRVSPLFILYFNLLNA